MMSFPLMDLLDHIRIHSRYNDGIHKQQQLDFLVCVIGVKAMYNDFIKY